MSNFEVLNYGASLRNFDIFIFIPDINSLKNVNTQICRYDL